MNSSTWTDAQALSYLASHPDLMAAFGADVNAAKRHYAGYGASEGREITFDPFKYIASYADLRLAFGTDAAAGARHFIVQGSSEGRAATFDALKYVASYGDLIAAFGTDEVAAERHYIVSGANEGRTATFDALRYVASYGDLILAFGNNQIAAERHFINSGFGENRVGSFDAVGYLLTYGDLGAAGLGVSGALAHWLTSGYNEARVGDQLFGREQPQHSLTVGSAIGDVIDKSGDRDWFQVAAKAGDIVQLDLRLSTGSSTITVFDVHGKAVALNSSNADGSTVTFTAAAAGTFYVVARANGSLTGAYSLSTSYYFTPKVGTSGADTLLGTDGRDLLRGLGGDDTLEGRGGDDVLEGGLGYDTLNGGFGDDKLYGNNAANSGVGDFNDNLTDDQGGNDQLFGQDGADFIYVARYSGPASIVLLDGGLGDDNLYFSSFRFIDTVTIIGGSGNDSISVDGALQSTIDAGDGNDKVTINTLRGSQTITLGNGADVVTLAETYNSFASGGSIHVTDFQNGTDMVSLDRYLAAVLFGWDGANPFTNGYLKLVQSGSNTLLQIDRDASAGTSYGLETLLTFDNRSVASFTAADLGYAPDGSAPVGRTIVGTSGADTLTGSDGNDVIQGLGGDDTLDGRGGADVLEGGLGYDRLTGGMGDDKLYGNNAANSGAGDFNDVLNDDQGGNDQLFGQDGSDSIYVSRTDAMAASTVLIDGGLGDDSLNFYTFRFADTVTVLGGAGNDTINVDRVLQSTIDAGDGNDKVTINTLGGSQTITLGNGADVLTLAETYNSFASSSSIHVTDFQNGTDTVSLDRYLAGVLIGWDGTNPFTNGYLKLVQSGSDTLLQIDRDASAGTSYSLGTLLTFDNRLVASFTPADLGYAPDGSAPVGRTIIGTSGADTLTGSDGNDLLQGLGGDDTLDGRGGADVLEGGLGFDRLTGGFGDDKLYGNNATNSGASDFNDQLTDDQGGNDQLFGQDGSDYIYVSRYDTMAASNVLIDGGLGDDSLSFYSSRFVDTVTVLGGAGNDTINVDRALQSTINAGDGNDKVTINTSGGSQIITLGNGADVLTLAQTFGSFASGNPIRVTDFQNGTDTVSLDRYLTAVLIGWDGTNPFTNGYLKLVQSGSDTLLQIDRDASAGTSYGLETLLTFDNRLVASFTATDLGYAPAAQGSHNTEAFIALDREGWAPSLPSMNWESDGSSHDWHLI